MMTSINLKFRPSKAEGKPGTIYFRLIHCRMMRQISTGYKLYSWEWENGKVKLTNPEVERYHYLTVLHERLQKDEARLQGIVRCLEQTGQPYTTEQVAEAFRRHDDDPAKFCVFATHTAWHLKDIGQKRLAETYAASANSFMRFRGRKGDIRMDELDSDTIKEYEHYLLKDCGLKKNTSSFYMRNLRAVYNRAVEKELVEDHRPFKGVYTGVDKTAKKAVSLGDIQKIKKLDLSGHPELEQTRDYFLLSFYMKGISFVDMSNLKTKDLQGGMLTYHRQKTNQQICIRWEEPMREIVNRYHVSGSPYLLPIIDAACGDGRRQYQNGLHRMNVHLKIIGEMVNCPVRLTTYCARHGWASIARSLNVPLPVISESMGHRSESTTRIYLASLDSTVMDEANRLVIGSV